MSSTYIETGSRIRVYDSAVRTHQELPLGTYKVHFEPKDGFSLQKVARLTVGEETIYGDRESKVAKIFRSYRRTDRSLGVMLSGDKGQGKSLFLRMVSEAALEAGIPVVLVTEDAEGIADFLDTLEECLIIFDEFEKNFPGGSRGRIDGRNRQNQFLSLFDGISSVKRMYCLTVNDVGNVSEYIHNRPGRFHYHMRFDYPGPDEVRQYLRDQAPLASPVEIENTVLFSRRHNLNFDHLRAIAFELNHSEALFSEVVEDLNLKATEPSTFRVVAKFDDGSTFTDESAINLYDRGQVSRTVELQYKNRSIFLSFQPRDLVFEDDGGIYLPVDKAEMLDDEDEIPEAEPVSISLTLIGQDSFGFDRF